MAHYRVRVTVPYITGAGTDIFVNNWSIEATNLGALGVAIGNISTFYNVAPALGVLAPADYLGDIVDRSVNAGSIDAYDRAALPGSGPVVTIPFTLAAITGGPFKGMPEEVAVALSMHADLSGAVNKRRRRGRIFFGPFNDRINGGGAGFPFQLLPQLITDLAASASEFMDATSDAAVEGLWEVYSTADATGRPVVGGWVDDRPDTIRSRGRGAETKTLWS